MIETKSNAQLSAFRIWHSLLIGLVAGWVLAVQSSENLNNAFSKMSNLQLLVQPGFLGIVVGFAVFPIAVGTLGWFVAKVVPQFRTYAPHTALACTIVTFLILFSGATIQKSLPKTMEKTNENSAIQSHSVISIPSSQTTEVPSNVEQGWNLSALPDVIDGRWKLIHVHPMNKRFLDTQSINTSPPYSTVWIKTFFQTPFESGVTTTITHVFIRCSTRSSAIGDTHGYTKDGTERDYLNFKDNNKIFSPITPDDAEGELLFNMLCQK